MVICYSLKIANQLKIDWHFIAFSCRSPCSGSHGGPSSFVISCYVTPNALLQDKWGRSTLDCAYSFRNPFRLREHYNFLHVPHIVCLYQPIPYVPLMRGTLSSTSQTYTIYASSSSACNTFFRSLAGAIFPVASHSIISSLGTKWGGEFHDFLMFAVQNLIVSILPSVSVWFLIPRHDPNSPDFHPLRRISPGQIAPRPGSKCNCHTNAGCRGRGRDEGRAGPGAGQACAQLPCFAEK